MKPAYTSAERTPCVLHTCDAPCCVLYEVPLLEEDIERLRKAGMNPSEFVEYENNLAYLRKNEEGCIFLRGGVCTVHPIRPAACRTYPFVVREKGEIALDGFCPYSSEFSLTDEMQRMLESLPQRLDEESRARNICRNHSCTACCHNTEMPLSARDTERLTSAGYSDFFIRDEKGYPVLRNVNERCIFLGEDGCTIYNIRPEGCRLYPFILGEDGVELDPECPHRKEFSERLGPGIEERLRELVRRIEEERDRDTG